MKKILSYFLILFFSISSMAKGATDTKNWYQYSGYSLLHNFIIKFPSDWVARIVDEQLQGFSPKNQYDKPPYFVIQEFNGQTYDQIINYYTDNDVSLINAKDILISTKTENLLGKQVTYQKKSSGADFTITFIKRGSLILALVPDTAKYSEYQEIFIAMTNSLEFADDWHQYIDFKNKYTFIFPENFILKSLDNGAQVSPTKNSQIIFAVQEYNNSFSPQDINSDYYAEFIQEMRESFEIFDATLEGEDKAFTNFPDVKDSHENAKAINGLFKEKIINGYPDGTFKPDGEINRAELTKMIVATKKQPSLKEYSNCFPDVQGEWFAPYICYAKSKGWILGYADGKFKPASSVTRAEAIKIIINGLLNGKINSQEELIDQSVLDIKPDDWYRKYFIFLSNRKLLDKQHIIKKDNGYLYLPNGNITRKEVAEMIYRIKNLK